MDCDRIIANRLNDAYSIEQAILDTLENHANEIQDEELKKRVEEQIEDIHNQAKKISDRVESLGFETVSTGSELVTWVENASILSFANEDDKLVKYSIIEYALKYFQRATITNVAAAAEECQDEITLNLCNQILEKELEDIEVLEQDLKGATIDFINKQTSEKTKIDWEEGQDEL